ncbi:dipeptidase [Bacillus carboniphilus]|uniref:Dipeptidase n=1 Tax=Bacillus carboniphilus TaxID=86663 RepID=A0ABN0WS25_9BACI
MSIHLFDFSLTTEQESRAKRLHEESIIIDMLFQGPMSPPDFSEEVTEELKKRCEKYIHDPNEYVFRIMRESISMAAEGKLPAFKDCWIQSGITAGNRQISGGRGSRAMEESLQSITSAQQQFDSFDWLIKATKGEHIRQAKREGKVAGMVTTQDTEWMGTDLENLEMMYKFGLRVVQLTYNMHNFVGAGCTERSDAGISNFGVKFIQKMNELGILVDTGHTGRQSTLDACEISDAPVIASHTACKAVSGHARGKDDYTLEAIAKTGGVIGVVTVPQFLNQEKDRPDMNDFLDHVDHLVKLVGVEHVGIGTDWPMNMPLFIQEMIATKIAPTIGFRKEDKLPGADSLLGFEQYTEAINITRGLVSRGYKDDQIKLILGENWMRVIEQVW